MFMTYLKILKWLKFIQESIWLRNWKRKFELNRDQFNGKLINNPLVIAVCSKSTKTYHADLNGFWFTAAILYLFKFSLTNYLLTADEGLPELFKAFIETTHKQWQKEIESKRSWISFCELTSLVIHWTPLDLSLS